MMIKFESLLVNNNKNNKNNTAIINKNYTSSIPILLSLHSFDLKKCHYNG